MQLYFSIENVAMNDYDFGKYYRRNNNKPITTQKSTDTVLQKFYRKISIAVAAGLILFFAGLMTGIHFQNKRIVTTASTGDEKLNDLSDIIKSADINTESARDPAGVTHPTPRHRPNM